MLNTICPSEPFIPCQKWVSLCFVLSQFGCLWLKSVKALFFYFSVHPRIHSGPWELQSGVWSKGLQVQDLSMAHQKGEVGNFGAKFINGSNYSVNYIR